jgi:hypothetical protein
MLSKKESFSSFSSFLSQLSSLATSFVLPTIWHHIGETGELALHLTCRYASSRIHNGPGTEVFLFRRCCESGRGYWSVSERPNGIDLFLFRVLVGIF